MKERIINCVFFGFMGLLLIASIFVFVTSTSKVIDDLERKGLKSVFERVWEGDSTGGDEK